MYGSHRNANVVLMENQRRIHMCEPHEWEMMDQSQLGVFSYQCKKCHHQCDSKVELPCVPHSKDHLHEWWSDPALGPAYSVYRVCLECGAQQKQMFEK